MRNDTALERLIGPDVQRLARARIASALAPVCAIGQAGGVALAIEAIATGAGLRSVAWAVALFLAASTARIGLDAVAQMLAAQALRRVQARLRSDIARSLAVISPAEPRRPAAGLSATLMSDHVEALGPYVTRYAPARLRVAIAPLAILVAVAVVSWIAALVLVVAGPLVPIFMALIGGRAKAASETRLAEMASLGETLLDRLRGLRDLRLLGATGVAQADLEARARALHAGAMGVLRIAFLSSAVLELFAALGVALVAVHVGFNLLGVVPVGGWGGPLTLASGLFVLVLAPEFFQPLRDFAAAYHDRAAAQAAAEALAAALPRDALVVPGAGTGETPSRRGAAALAFEAAGLHHPGAAAPALREVSFAVAPGERVALVGPSGAGKSTLLALAAGLVSPTAGSVVADGVPLDASNAAAWRRRIAWIGQDPALFAASLRANLDLARANARPDSSLEAAIELAGLAPVLARLPRGLGTPLGEGGAGLSGGEIRRLTLARAALADADIVLADEPTAHLDPRTARAVTEGLLELSRGRTLVVATHDPALAAAMDRRILVRDGQVA